MPTLREKTDAMARARRAKSAAARMADVMQSNLSQARIAFDDAEAELVSLETAGASEVDRQTATANKLAAEAFLSECRGLLVAAQARYAAATDALTTAENMVVEE